LTVRDTQPNSCMSVQSTNSSEEDRKRLRNFGDMDSNVWEQARKRAEMMRREDELLRKTPELQLQRKLFMSWMALGGIGYAKVEDNVGYVWCPKHDRWETLTLECGLLNYGLTFLFLFSLYVYLVEKTSKKIDTKFHLIGISIVLGVSVIVVILVFMAPEIIDKIIELIKLLREVQQR